MPVVSGIIKSASRVLTKPSIGHVEPPGYGGGDTVCPHLMGFSPTRVMHLQYTAARRGQRARFGGHAVLLRFPASHRIVEYFGHVLIGYWPNIAS